MTKELQPAVVAVHLFQYNFGFRTCYGTHVEVQQRVFATGDTPPGVTALLVEGASYNLPKYYVPVIDRGDLHADRVPLDFDDDPVGAIATLLLPHGATERHVRHALQLVWDTPLSRASRSVSDCCL